MRKRSQVLTTGEVAKICHVAPRTVSKWFDSGQLGGYRIPGSRDRRIPLPELVAFMRAHKLPMDGLEVGPGQVLVVGEELARAVRDSGRRDGAWEVHTAIDAFEAGIRALELVPAAIFLDASADVDAAMAACRAIKRNPSLRNTKVLAVLENKDDTAAARLLGGGLDGTVTCPLSPGQIETALRKVV
ncbi:MAG: helix-turn-helix domain-containing protein [Phycisphaerae bacterium]